MKVFLASDHTGIELKAAIKMFLEEKKYEVVDCGALEFDKYDDYPDFISKAAEEVSKDPENAIGFVVGGSAQGEAMAANKFKNVRCAVFYAKAVPVGAADITGRVSDDPFEIIKLTREHNNSNMLSLSARFLTQEDALHAVELFVSTPFPGDERHKRRIDKISKLES